MCSEHWSADDEKQLNLLMQRKQEVMGKRRTVLLAVVQKLPFIDEEGVPSLNDLTDALIDHADEVTSALKPFTRKETGVQPYKLPDFGKVPTVDEKIAVEEPDNGEG